MKPWDEVMALDYPTAARAVDKRLQGRLRAQMDAEDIVSEAILGLLQGGRAVADRAGALTALSRNTLIDHQRRISCLKRRREVGSRDYDRDPAIDLGPGMERAAIARETVACLLAISSADQGVILRMIRDGHSTDDCARATGWNRRRVQRFLQSLRPLIEK